MKRAVVVLVATLALAGAPTASAVLLVARTRAEGVPFGLAQARQADLRSERAFWRGYRIKVTITRCWWLRRGTRAKCRVVLDGSFFTIGRSAPRLKVAGYDEIGRRGARLVVWQLPGTQFLG